jgi:hypothetical protein
MAEHNSDSGNPVSATSSCNSGDTAIGSSFSVEKGIGHDFTRIQSGPIIFDNGPAGAWNVAMSGPDGNFYLVGVSAICFDNP